MNIVLLGSGNVATHLSIALDAVGENIVQVFSPNIKHAKQLADKLNTQAINNLSEIDSDADLYIISVKDDAIAEVATSLSHIDALVVHTSGTTDIKVISSIMAKAGVFYPLQTFSKAKELNFNDVPLCIEATAVEELETLKILAHKLSNKVYELNGEKRKVLHLAAVFACNFTNHLYSIANELLVKSDLDFDIIRPLIAETTSKVLIDLPVNLQTGPAVRNDESTMNKHLAMLADLPELQEIYQTLSNSIKLAHK